MSKRPAKWFLFALICMCATLQQSPFKELAKIATEAYYLSTDNLGNAYVITTAHDLNKYKPDGSFYTTQNIKVNGPVTSMDATNTLQVNLFYRPLNKVVILDNLLAFRGEVKLQDLGISQASAAARSFDNGIWVFDLGDLQLKKIDKDLKQVVQQSGNLRMVMDKNAHVNPNFILDDATRVYVCNPETGILVFDVFAQYLKTIPLKGLDHFQTTGDELTYFANNKLNSYNLRTAMRKTMELPDTSNLVDVRREKNRLYLLHKNGLNLYSY